MTVWVLLFLSCRNDNDSSQIRDIPVEVTQVTPKIPDDSNYTSIPAPAPKEPSRENQKSDEKAASKDKIDIDFSKMNDTITFAQISNMVFESENYLGKNIRIDGELFVTYNEQAHANMFSVIRYDATACCQTGFDFIIRGNPTYPDEFPPVHSKIQVTGVYSITDRYGFDYYYLDCEKINVVQK